MGYTEDVEKARRYAERVQKKQEIYDIKHSNDKAKNPLSFSKIAVIFIFANCLAIELYSMVVMAVFHDLSSLGSLIAAVVGQCITIISYNIKAGRENTANGIVYETAMYGLRDNVEVVSEEKKEEEKSEDDGAVG